MRIFSNISGSIRITLLLFLGFTSTACHGVSQPLPKGQCIDKLDSIQSEFDNAVIEGGITSLDNRFQLFESVHQECLTLASFYIWKAEYYFNIREFLRSINIMDHGIAKGATPLGNLYRFKAQRLQLLKKSGAKYSSFKEIRKLFKKALEENNSVEVLIYLGLAQNYILSGEPSKAIGYIEIGSKIKPLSRFYSLGSIAEVEMNNYKEAYRYLGKAISIGGEKSLREPDAVLAFSKIYCHSGEIDLAKTKIRRSIELNSKFQDHPWILEAVKIVEECQKESRRTNQDIHFQ